MSHSSPANILDVQQPMPVGMISLRSGRWSYHRQPIGTHRLQLYEIMVDLEASPIDSLRSAPVLLSQLGYDPHRRGKSNQISISVDNDLNPNTDLNHHTIAIKQPIFTKTPGTHRSAATLPPQ